MEPLQQLIQKADEAGIFSPLLQGRRRFRSSLYADDVAIFIKPDQLELQALKKILNAFGNCSGLHVNLQKTEIYPISCDNVNLDLALTHFPGLKKSFPCTYLGIPLHTKKLRRVDLQPLIDKVGARIPGWKGRFFTSAGRKILVKSTLSSTPIYHLTVLQQNKWLYKRIDRLRRAFLWKGDEPENVSGGSSLVCWQNVCKPKNLGGLGILNLEKFARALRLRWLWIEWKDDSKPWNNTQTPCNELDRDLFRAGTTIKIGDGRTANFWMDNWLEGQSLKNLAPSIFRLAKRKSGCVRNELSNNHWLAMLHQITTVEEINDLVHLGDRLRQVVLDENVKDDITWNWTGNGQYSTKSAYLAQFNGTTAPANFSLIWSSRAEPKHRFFGWLILHKRTLTAENLLIRHWPCDWICSLCRDAFEDATHLAKDCAFTQTVWKQICDWHGYQHIHTDSQSIADWMEGLESIRPTSDRKKIIGMLLTSWWHVWLERNRRVFQKKIVIAAASSLLD